MPLLEEEMNLMCHVIMNDSCWLDSFQTSVLSGDRATKEFVSPRLVPIVNQDSFESQLVAPMVTTEDSHPTAACQRYPNFDCFKSKDVDQEKKFWSTEINRNTQASAKSRTITAPMSVVDQLPAPEFVDGTHSMVASESLRMISAVTTMLKSNNVTGIHFEPKSTL